MRIGVSAQGETLEAATSPVFGRCPVYVFVDSGTMEFEALPNPAMNQGGGAGIQAAQFVVEHGAQAVLTGNLGPNAFDVLAAANVPSYLVPQGTVRHAVEALSAGQVQPMSGANVGAHAGMGRGMGRGASLGGRFGAMPGDQPVSQGSHEAELTQLRETLKGLRQQLAETIDKIEALEKGR